MPAATSVPAAPAAVQALDGKRVPQLVGIDERSEALLHVRRVDGKRAVRVLRRGISVCQEGHPGTAKRRLALLGLGGHEVCAAAVAQHDVGAGRLVGAGLERFAKAGLGRRGAAQRDGQELGALGLVVFVDVALGEEDVVEAFYGAHVAGAYTEEHLLARLDDGVHEHRAFGVHAVVVHLLGLRKQQVLGRQVGLQDVELHGLGGDVGRELLHAVHFLGNVDDCFCGKLRQQRVQPVFCQ